MTPDEFLRQVGAKKIAPVYLFIGAEMWQRDRCRAALTNAVLPGDAREQGLTRHDLDEVELNDVLDDARSLSLFAPDRVIWARSAEAVLPRGRAASTEDGDGPGRDGDTAALAGYVKDPSPGVVVVFDCTRFDFEGEEKAKLQRVQKFYGCIPAVVEFARFSPAEARRLAATIAKDLQLRIGGDELELLVEVLAADVSRIACELEKLSLYVGRGRGITEEDIWNLAPNAKATTIFALVGAIGRGDRGGALEALDILVREGEYLPLALSFLATQFRYALAAKEARLSGASQVQAHFTKLGMQMWRSRAEQVAQTAAFFPLDKLRKAAERLYETDKALRDARPDDRTVMESFVLSLT